MVSGQDVWIEVLEWSKDETRSGTRQAIENVVAELAKVVAMPTDVDTGEFWRSVFPSGGVAESASLVVERQAYYEAYKIHGFINPGEPGVVMVRAFEASTGQELGEVAASLYRTEYVGWSKDKSVFFPFECFYHAPDTGTEELVRFEAWFYPRGGRCMITATQPGVRVVR
jgi:hypothetical protein